MRRTVRVAAVVTLLALPLPALAQQSIPVTLQESQCGCCENYAAYLRENGFTVDVKPTNISLRSAAKPACPKSSKAAIRHSSTATWSTVTYLSA